MSFVSYEQITEAGRTCLQLRSSSTAPALHLKRVSPPAMADSESLCFVGTPELLQTALNKNCRALIVLESLHTSHKNQIPENCTVWATPQIPYAMSCVLSLFDRKKDFFSPGIHPSAIVHPSAQVATSAHIGAHVVIEAHAVIGENTVLYPFVYIGHFCEVGSNCILAPHVTVGGDGFGFFSDKSGTHHKIPQIGKVVIEDHCEFGTHCAVDRATLSETRIKRGSKFDNFCHIAHNVVIGENALAAGGFMVAGSTTIGKNLTTAGGVHVNGHTKVADNVILTARAGVTQNIEKSGIYGGFPIEDHRESIKTLASIPHIKKMRKQIAKILRHLNLTEED